jgi:predicted nucleotidyltransferase
MISRNSALRILRRHEAELKARGVRRAGLDVLIEIDKARRLNVFEFVGIKRAVAELFPGRVDVVNAAALKSGVGRSVRRDLIYAF